jgi:PDDEXK-like uncharacterized protein DUF3799
MLPVRFSRLSKMRQSPAHYKWALDHDGDETKALRLGRAVHSFLLGGDSVVVYDGRRSGAKWEAFEQDNAGKIILIPSEIESAIGMRASLQNHDEAMSLLSLSRREEKIMWTFAGRTCQSTPDAFDVKQLTELKTTRSADPSRFVRDAIWRGYHAQCDFYRTALSHRDKDWAGPHRRCSIVAVESAPPYPVTVLHLTERALEAGHKLWRLWWERMVSCEQSGYWPAYTESAVPFDVEDQDDDFSLVIGGEEMTFGEGA